MKLETGNRKLETADCGPRPRFKFQVSSFDQPLVRPQRSKRSPNLGPLAVMVSTRADMQDLARQLELEPGASRRLFVSRLFPDADGRLGFALCGPVIGAPYAVMVLETLAAWGASRVVFAGWCGSLCPEVAVGDVVLVTGAFIDEGTSLHYAGRRGRQVAPSPSLTATMQRLLAARQIGFHQGPVWSTDGMFRETRRKVAHFRKKGALAVEMEISALLTAGRFLGLDVAAVAVVSDCLAGPLWQPGFKTPAFQQGRENLMAAIQSLASDTFIK